MPCVCYCVRAEPHVDATEPRRVCGLSCLGVEGQLPSVTCSVCKSMFHAACIGLSSEATEFTCRVCIPVLYLLHHTNVAWCCTCHGDVYSLKSECWYERKPGKKFWQGDVVISASCNTSADICFVIWRMQITYVFSENSIFVLCMTVVTKHMTVISYWTIERESRKNSLNM